MLATSAPGTQWTLLTELKVRCEREAEVGILAYPMVGKIGHNYH
ncbi:TPA: hypothetical protein ACGQTC_002851 [Citrobacter braakii]|nr:hypothetical protein [Citrobacter sp. JL976]